MIARVNAASVALVVVVLASCATQSSSPSDELIVSLYRDYARDRCNKVEDRIRQIDWEGRSNARRPFFDLMLGFCAERGGRIAEAIGLYQSVIENGPQFTQAQEASLRLREVRWLAENKMTREEWVENLTRIESPPNPIRLVEPEYPIALRVANVEGWVEIEFEISQDGRVESPYAFRSDPPFIFDSAAVSTMRHWIYEPSSSDVRGPHLQRIQFELSH